MDRDALPWERQEDESVQAYEAFVIYRDLGLARTAAKVTRELQKSRTLIQRWKRQWYWDERVLAYDNELQKEKYDEDVKAVRAMKKRHIKIAVQLQAKAMEALKELDARDLTPGNILAYLKLATDIEQYNRVSEIKDIDPPTMEDIKAEEDPYESLTLDELRRLAGSE